MASMSVDTLSIARNLRAVEMPQPQAEAIAAAIGSSILESTATTSDLAQLRAEIKHDITDLKSTMMMWFIVTGLTISAIVVAAIKL